MKRAELLTVIMHDIGLPVIEGVIQVALDQSEEKVIEDVTRLLRQTIDNADDIRGLLDLIEEEEKDVSVRLNLATLSCHIIAAHYKRAGTLPTQAELKRTVSSVDQLLTFSENYIPMDRLEGVFPENVRGLSPLSRTVANLVYLKYYVPLVDVVADFSFGMDEARMIQNVSEKLRTKAADITHVLMGTDLSVAEQKSSELLILSSLIPLYCSCHIREKDRIMGLDEDVRAKEENKDQIENIWLLFDKRLGMLTVLAKHIMPDHFTDEDIAKIENLFTDGSGLVDVDGAPDKTLANSAKDSGAVTQDTEENAEDDEPSMPTLRGEKPQRDPAKASPMGFFSSKEKTGEDSTSAGRSDGSKLGASTTSSAKEKAEDKEDEDKGKGKSSGGGGGPMSFFKE
jgi:hypothetical protein